MLNTKKFIGSSEVLLYIKCWLLEKRMYFCQLFVRIFIYLFIYYFFNVYFGVGEGQRARETQNPKQAPGSELSAASLTQGRNPQPWEHDLSWSLMLNWLSHPGAPIFFQWINLFWERGREWQRAWERESQVGSVLSVWSPTWGPNSQTMRSWNELKSRVGCSTHWATQAPLSEFLNTCG